MNRWQRLILITCALAALLMMLFPPFHFRGAGGIVLNQGYAFVLNPPLLSYKPASVDVSMLFAQWVGVAAIGAALYFALRGVNGPPPKLPAMWWKVALGVLVVAVLGWRIYDYRSSQPPDFSRFGTPAK